MLDDPALVKKFDEQRKVFTKQMQDMLDEYEADNRLPDKELDDFYAQYPALIKGDSFACQRVVLDVLNSLKNDFLREADTLYEMVQSHWLDEKIHTQQKKSA